MAYNKYVRFFFTSGQLEYDGVQLNELFMWGEFIVSPVLSGAIGSSFSPTGTVVIRMANDPRVYLAFAVNADSPDIGWEGFEVDGFSYDMDSVQIGPDGATIEVTGVDGTVIIPA